MAQWYFMHEGQPVGPLTADQLKEYGKTQLITSKTLVRRDDSSWIEASQVKGLLPPGAAETIKNETWYVQFSSGKVVGPISEEQLTAWVSEGKVTAENHLVREGWSQWMLASEVFPDIPPALPRPAVGPPGVASSHPPQPVPGDVSSVPMKLILGLAGSIILVVGVFAPMITAPIVGSVTFFQNGRGDGVFVMALAIVSLILIAVGWYRGLIATGLVSLLILAMDFINFQQRLNQLEREMAGNPFGGLATAAQLSWGFPLLAIGAVLLILAGAWRPASRPG